MLLLADGMEAYDAAVGLLAVHGAISLNDAIQVAVSGSRSKYTNHAQTIADLKRICRLNRIVSTGGVVHLTWLLSHKTAMSYGDRRFTDSGLARDKAERFRTWAFGTFKGALRVQEHLD